MKRYLGIAIWCVLTIPLQAFSAVTIVEITPLSFGMLQLPSSGSNNITIDYDSGASTGTATVIHDNATRGQYMFENSDSEGLMTIDIQNINTGSSAITLTDFKGRYKGQVINSFPVSGLSIPKARAILNLGATLTFTSAVAEDAYVMGFDIVVNYE